MKIKKHMLSFFSIVLMFATIIAPSSAIARDPAFQSCNTYPGLDAYGFVTMTSQATGSSLAWGMTFTPAGIAAIGNPISVSMVGATVVKDSNLEVRTLFPGTLYSTHTVAQPYLYHGSITSYSYVGSGASTATLASKDVVHLTFTAIGTLANGQTGTYANYGFTCKMP